MKLALQANQMQETIDLGQLDCTLQTLNGGVQRVESAGAFKIIGGIDQVEETFIEYT